MTTIDAKIRLQAQFGDAMKALNGLRTVVKEVTGEAAKPGSAVPFKPMRDGIASVSQQLALARTQLLQFVGLQAGIQGAAALANLVDGYAGLVARLRLVTSGQQEFNQALSATRSLAQQYQAPLNSTVQLYTRMASALRPLGGGATEVQVATEAMLASLKIAGATVAESSSAILQFSQAMGAGALRGEEFNAIAEAAPGLLDALAAGLGKPRDQLKALAEQGALTTSAVVGALQRELPKLQAEAAKIPETIGGAVQGLRDKFSSVVGSAAEGSEAIRALIAVIKTLTENLQPLINGLAALGVVLVSMKIGQAAVALASIAGAATTAAGGVGVLTIATRGLLALFGGPLGLIVAVGSLVAGWVALGNAKNNAGFKVTGEERAALQAEVDQLKAKIASTRAVAPQALLALREAEARLKRVDAVLEAEQQRKLDALRTSGGPRGGPGLEAGGGLKDPAAIKAFEDDNKTRERIVKEFADKRATYIAAKDRDIAAARLTGDRALEARLLAEKAGSLKEQAKSEAEALKKYAADSTLSRLAIYKDEYNSRAELAADATARELKLNQSLLDQQLRSTKEYFAARAALEEQESEQAIAKLQAELARKEAVLAKNRAVLAKASTANEREAAREAVTGNQSDVDKTRSEIERQQRDAAERRRQRGIDEQLATRELERQSEELDYQTRSLNKQLTLADLRLAAERQFADARRKELAETGSARQTDALIEAQVRVAELQRLQSTAQTYFAAVQQAEQEIDTQVRLGVLTTQEAEQQKFDARAKAIPQLRAILEAMRAIAKTDDEKLAVQGLIDRLGTLAVKTNELQEVTRGAVSSGFAQLFTDVATGAKTAGDAVRDFAAGVAKSMLDLIAKRLGEKLMLELMGSGEGGSSGGGWMATVGNAIVSAFSHHTGGVVGASGAPRYAPLLAYANAPRYHGGGIAGLRPGEVPAVLMEGEEVVTEANPRHIKNFKGGTGDVNIAVKVEGAQGTDADMNGAGNRLGEMIRGVVNRWAIDESREGGILAKGRR